MMSVAAASVTRPRISIVMPALDEAAAIGAAVSGVRGQVDAVIVCDNGSRDGTGMLAAAAGAVVVREAERGYGAACLAALAALPPCDIVVFMDADGSDVPDDLPALVAPIVEGWADLVIGSRVRGTREKGALTPQQVFGNALACRLIWLIWHVDFSDLGPFRAIRREALERLAMQDRDFGWTVEMQVRAAARGLRCAEVPVGYRRRVGRSKISGTLSGVLRAGTKILWVIGREALKR
jgi:glycosyltransferase involved in cell wall biosynthesis